MPDNKTERYTTADFRAEELAMEQLDRSVQLAKYGRSELLGWMHRVTLGVVEGKPKVTNA
jgi:hypothetical protein